MVVQHAKRMEFVSITRRVFIAGESVEAGKVVEVGEQLAAELVASAKAERCAAPEPDPDPDAGADADKSKPKARGKAASDA